MAAEQPPPSDSSASRLGPTPVTEPAVWLFDGARPERDLPEAEAEAVASMGIVYGDPLLDRLPESAVAGVRELLRGFFAHTPYRRIRSVEREDERTVRIDVERRESHHGGDWERWLHPADARAMQDRLCESFGPLWRLRRGNAEADTPTPGTAHVHRMLGRQFRYRGESDER